MRLAATRTTFATMPVPAATTTPTIDATTGTLVGTGARASWATTIDRRGWPLRVAAATLAAVAASLPLALGAPAYAATPLVPAGQLARVDTCVIDDARAVELSGLARTGSGYVAINDGQDDSTSVRIFFLDDTCKVTRTVAYPSAARDPEDVAVGPDGTVWVADIGDNLTSTTRRESVALWRVPADNGAPVIHRLTYPDGPHDAEALLFDGDGLPIIVTKEISGSAGLYKPAAPLQPQTTTGVALKKVGDFTAQSTGIENLLGRPGETMVTGAATSADRHRVALRTYTAAYEWDVSGGDVVKAITTTPPRFTALPDEPQGEAIAYSADGANFVTVSDEAGPTTMRTWPRSDTGVPPPPPSAGANTGPVAAPPPTGLAALPLWVSVAIGVGGAGLLAAGAVGLRRGRREAAEPPPAP